MRTTRSALPPTFLALSLLAAGGAAWAADDTELNALTKPASTVSIGGGGWSNVRPKLGGSDGMRGKAGYLLLDADVLKRDDATGTWQYLNINDLGTGNREFRAGFLQQGQQGIDFDFSQFRSDVPYTINTNQQGIDTSTQTTGANIPKTALGSGSNYQFGTDRTKGAFSFYKNLGTSVDFNFKVSTEDKKGNRITSNGSALFVAEPINWTTNKAEATLDYKGESLWLSGGYLGSWFKNNDASDLVSLGAGATRTTQPLDNQAHQFFVSGTYNFSPGTVSNFKLSQTRGTQDERLPTSSIASAAYANIPSLQGRVDTTLMQAGLTGKPMPNLSLVANVRYHDMKDKTPQYTTVRSTDNTANIAVNTTPYSYTNKSVKLEASYRLPENTSLTAGVDLSQQNRSVFTTMGAAAYNAYVPMRSKLDETTYRLQLGKSLSETLNGSLAYFKGKRGGSDFTTSTQVGTALVSPVNSADRDRQKVRLVMDWTPVEKLGVQFNVETAKDQYSGNERSQGLREGNANTYSLDVSYQFNADWQLAGWSSINTNNANFINYGTATNSLIRKQNDTSEAFGLTLSGNLNPRIKIGAELSLSTDKTAFEQSNSNGTATGVVAPDITSEATRLKMYANYALEKNADLRFDLAYDKWQTNDWQWNYTTGLPWQFGTATDGTTVTATPRQDATFLGVRYIYKF